MYFFIKDENIFDKYNEIWEEVINIIKKAFSRELIHNKKYLNAEINSTQKEAFIVFVKEQY